MGAQYIPFNPYASSAYWISQGLRDLFSGLGQGLATQQANRLMGQDLQRLQAWSQSQLPTGQVGPQMPFPAFRSPQMSQMAAQAMVQNVFRETPIQKLVTEEGYDPGEAKMIRDIYHGLKPRASAVRRLEEKSLPEQLAFWQTVYNKTLDPEWGGTKPTADMDTARSIAKQNMDSITTQMKEQGQKQGNKANLESDLRNAISAINRGADKFKVYERIAGQYPEMSNELKRILLFTPESKRLDATREALFGRE